MQDKENKSLMDQWDMSQGEFLILLQIAAGQLFTQQQFNIAKEVAEKLDGISALIQQVEEAQQALRDHIIGIEKQLIHAGIRLEKPVVEEVVSEAMPEVSPDYIVTQRQAFTNALGTIASATAWRSKPTGIWVDDTLPKNFWRTLTIEGNTLTYLEYLKTANRSEGIIPTVVQRQKNMDKGTFEASILRLTKAIRMVLYELGIDPLVEVPALNTPSIDWFLNKFLKRGEHRTNWRTLFSIASGHIIVDETTGRSILDPRRVVQVTKQPTQQRSTPLDKVINLETASNTTLGSPQKSGINRGTKIEIYTDQSLVAIIEQLKHNLRVSGQTIADTSAQVGIAPSAYIRKLERLHTLSSAVIEWLFQVEIGHKCPTFSNSHYAWFLDQVLIRDLDRETWEPILRTLSGQVHFRDTDPIPTVLNMGTIPRIEGESPLESYPTPSVVELMHSLISKKSERGDDIPLQRYADQWGLELDQMEQDMVWLERLARHMHTDFLANHGGTLPHMPMRDAECIVNWQNNPYSLGMWNGFWVPFFDLFCGIPAVKFDEVVNPKHKYPEGGIPMPHVKEDHLAVDSTEISRRER